MEINIKDYVATEVDQYVALEAAEILKNINNLGY